MRLININTLKSGSRIKMPIRKPNGQVLLPAGSLLTDRYINRLKNFGFNAVYIDDDLFTSIEAVPVLTDETKSYALSALEDFFQCCKKGMPFDVNAAKEAGSKIYEDVFSVCDKPINLFNIYVVDNPLCLHSVNVAAMAAALTVASDMKSNIAKDIVTGALLHDIIVEDIKNKEDHEYPAKALEYLKSHHGLSTISYMTVAMHHENYDGSGYPKKLKEKEIYEGARIIGVCDTYDNLVYGLAGYGKMSEYHAVEYINGYAGSVFDPEIVSLFNKAIAIYPTGATVILDNGSAAIVTRQNAGMPSRPVVRLLMRDWEDCLEFDLMTSNTVFIKKVDL